jgi:hypothetical protein
MEASMHSRPPHHTLRVPPAVIGPSGELARTLHERPPELDDVSRARMERSLVQAWRLHASARVPLPGQRAAAPRARALWAASIAASAIAGGLLAFSMTGREGESAPTAGSGHFELRIGDAAVQAGAVAEGQVLESGALGRMEIELPSARLRMSRATRVRIDRVSGPELTVSLLKGRLEVDFHPAHKGDLRMAVESVAARVQVVGTRFVLDVDAIGNTDVTVSEGVVEVLPRSGGALRRVAAGEHTHVRADEGDEYERKVRDTIEENLRTLEAPAADPIAAADDAFQPDMEFTAEEQLDPAGAAQKPARAIARKLEQARKLLRQGQHSAARARLRGLASSNSAPVHIRVEALTLMAESYTAQGDVPKAAQAYRRADELSPGDAAGHNARFAHARLLERYAHDERAAAEAYRRYLEHAPRGALATQARQALCRLGENQFCR